MDTKPLEMCCGTMANSIGIAAFVTEWHGFQLSILSILSMLKSLLFYVKITVVLCL